MELGIIARINSNHCGLENKWARIAEVNDGDDHGRDNNDHDNDENDGCNASSPTFFSPTHH